jgi:hypothetical protein
MTKESTGSNSTIEKLEMGSRTRLLEDTVHVLDPFSVIALRKCGLGFQILAGPNGVQPANRWVVILNL